MIALPRVCRRLGQIACAVAVVWGLAHSGMALGSAQNTPASSPHFLVYPKARATLQQAQRAAAVAEHAFRPVTDRLGFAPTTRMVIELYGQPAAFQRRGGPPTAVGIVETPSNIARIDLWRSAGDSYRVLAHEIAHLVMARALGGDLAKCPRWFNEGVAVWASRTGALDTNAEGARVAPAKAVPPEALNARLLSADDAEIAAAYAESAALVAHLAGASGEDAIPRIIRAIPQSPDFDAALRRVVGLTSAQLYDDWLRQAEAQRVPLPWWRLTPEIVILLSMGVLAVLGSIRIVLRRRRWQRRHRDEDSLTEDEIRLAREVEERLRERMDGGDDA